MKHDIEYRIRAVVFNHVLHAAQVELAIIPPPSPTVALTESAVVSGVAPNDAEGDNLDDGSGTTFPNIYQKDGYLLFRALCRLSMKPIPPGQLPESQAVRSKLQALQLIRGVLENAGLVFMSGDKFAYAIKQYRLRSVHNTPPLPLPASHEAVAKGLRCSPYDSPYDVFRGGLRIIILEHHEMTRVEGLLTLR